MTTSRDTAQETWAWAPVILLVTAFIQYYGASIAVHLFAVASVLAVGWGRAFSGSLMLLAWRRPKIDVRSAAGRRALIGPAILGVALVSTNLIFYLAIARIPLGTTVALEFIGPVILALVAGRGWRVRLAVVFAVSGIFMISWVGVDLNAPGVAAGIVLAILAGLFWATYMYMGRRLTVEANGFDSLAIGMFIGSLVYLPVVLPDLPVIFGDAKILGLVVLVGLLSSVTPYVGDMVIMKRINAGTFALLNSLLPAASLLVGIIFLKQIPTPGELGGLVLITIAVALANYPGNSLQRKTSAKQNPDV
ncbi:MAG: EamA family transporter [Actinomycetaceae bacterium]|nr:EamA family transporter [Actinomycetaceae bacterium]